MYPAFIACQVELPVIVRMSLGEVYVPCVYRMPGGVIVKMSPWWSCVPCNYLMPGGVIVGNSRSVLCACSMCDVKFCSSANYFPLFVDSAEFRFRQLSCHNAMHGEIQAALPRGKLAAVVWH